MTIESDRARKTTTVRFDCLAEEGLRGSDSAIRTQQEIDGLPILIDGSIQLMPPTPDADVRLVDAPRPTDRTTESPQRFSNSGTYRRTHRRIVEWATLTPHSDIISTKVAIGKPIAHVPAQHSTMMSASNTRFRNIGSRAMGLVI